MKRTPLNRSKPLRPDPEKVRDWMRRSRSTLKRSKPKRRAPVPSKTLSDIHHYSGGVCVVCGTECDARRDRHHVLPVRTWPEYELTAENQVLACINCHMNHESAARRITLEELPAAVFVWVLARAGQSGSVRAYVQRTYPLGTARRSETTEVGYDRRRDRPW